MSRFEEVREILIKEVSDADVVMMSELLAAHCHFIYECITCPIKEQCDKCRRPSAAGWQEYLEEDIENKENGYVQSDDTSRQDNTKYRTQNVAERNGVL